ncbi:MAG: hypothetical protein K2F77_06830 [Muribaculaceae bacterium]|nr:hypothetical protein [Muribaculaceae bacterium]
MKVKRSVLIPAVLLVYLVVMACIGYPEYAAGRTSALYYFGVIAITLVVLVLLYFSLRRRERYREEREKDMQSSNKQNIK